VKSNSGKARRQVPLRDAQILARHADPRTTEHHDRARGNLDRHGVHFLTAYVAGV
jgi:integrase/recombinase XerD